MLFQNKISKYFLPLILIAIGINALGLFNDILEPDGALYASIAKHIALNNDWINLYGNGADWLDKPHFPFWITAIFYKIFGINAFAYKLPNFIAFIFCLIYTYKLALEVCSKQVAQMGTLIFATSLHVLLCNFDVRAEIYLTFFVTASIYYLIISSKNNWLKNIIAAAFFTALAIMTKGIFVFITIGSGFVLYWLVTQQYKEFLNFKWYLYVFASFVFIIPELFCLYAQFDLHPEKIVFEKTNVSGLNFFFWDSQFGRFFNNGPIKGSGDLSFFFHTTIWAYMPWSILLFFVVFKKFRGFRDLIFTKQTILYAAALVSFILFSVSKFQLPHYIVIVFPLFSIMLANYINCNGNLKTIRLINIFHNINFSLLLIVLCCLIWFYKLQNTLMIVVLMLIILVIFFFIFNKKTTFNIIAKGMCFAALLSIFLNIFFYPNLMQYQAGMMAGKWQQKNMIQKNIPMYKCNEYSFEFYGNTSLKRISAVQSINKQETVLGKLNDIKQINQDSFATKIIQSFPYFHVTLLTKEFINHKTRNNTLDTLVIADITRKL